MRKSRLLTMAVLMMALLPVCGSARGAGEPEYHILSVTVDEDYFACNYTRHGLYVAALDDTGRPNVLVAQEGDLLNWGDYVFRYSRAHARELAFTAEGPPLIASLNGRPFFLYVENDPDLRAWIEESDAAALRSLELLWIGGDLDELTLASLEKIAAVRPDIGLALGAEAATVSVVLSLFMPTFLFCSGEVLEPEAGLLPRLKKVECLFLLEELPERIDLLSELPRLRSLILQEVSLTPETALSLRKLKRLRSLTLIGSEIDSLSELGLPPRLEDLCLVGCGIEDVGALRELPRLRGLGLLRCEELSDLSPLRELSGLRWISFPPGTGQEDFAAVIGGNPQLQVVDLVKCPKVNNLVPLSALKGLKALTLYDTAEDLEPLQQLESLEALIVAEDEHGEEELLALQAALPDTRIAYGGFCLGSGWLLLLLPGVALLLAMRRLAGKLRR